MNSKKIKGFSLVELLVVVSIIAILAAILMLNITGAAMKSRDSKRKSDLSDIKTGIDMYYDLSTPPREHPSNGSSSNYACIIGSADCLSDTLVPTYLPSLPKDPKTGDTSQRVSGETLLNEYWYYDFSQDVTTNTYGYFIGTTLENEDERQKNTDFTLPDPPVVPPGASGAQAHNCKPGYYFCLSR